MQSFERNLKKILNSSSYLSHLFIVYGQASYKTFILNWYNNYLFRVLLWIGDFNSRLHLFQKLYKKLQSMTSDLLRMDQSKWSLVVALWLATWPSVKCQPLENVMTHLGVPELLPERLHLALQRLLSMLGGRGLLAVSAVQTLQARDAARSHRWNNRKYRYSAVCLLHVS